MTGARARRLPDARVAGMVLGTVQLGVPYGRCNDSGMPSSEQALAILKEAALLGVRAIDTARLYGASEHRIGIAAESGLLGSVPIVTKLGVDEAIVASSPLDDVRGAVRESVETSLRELRQERLDVLLLHRWAHRHARDGVVWERLLELKDAGMIGKLGASVQSPSEAVEALGDSEVRHIQMPLNLLDARWEEAGVGELAASRQDVEVHARSVFLQGILLGPAEAWPPVDGVDAHQLKRIIESLSVELHRASVADLCVAFVRGLSWVDGLVLGVDTVEQLLANARLFAAQPLTADEHDVVRATLPAVPVELVDPSRW